MKMKEFAEIVKGSKIAGNSKCGIIYQLLEALGAKSAVSESAKGVYKKIQSPSQETIKKWFSGSEPDTIRYFPSRTVEDKEEEAHNFLLKLAGGDKWKNLRNLFKEWHDNNQSFDGAFYINTETEDFRAFSTSFWKQFVSYFKSLRMWDIAEEQYQEHGIKDEIINIFKENFLQYRVYEFIPKDIKNVIESLFIYREIMDESDKSVMHESSVSDRDAAHNSIKMYCKWFPNYDNFFFYAAVGYNGFWKLQIPGECILLKFPESFEHDMMPTNTWMTGSFKYAIVNPIPDDEQFKGEELPWKECQCDVIFIDINIPTETRESANKSIPAKAAVLVKGNASVNQGVSASEDIPINGDCTIIEDCYEFIDGMLALNSTIDEFMAIINEKIIKKYEDVTFDDNPRLLYNDIKQYRKSLKKFKKYLIKFRNLEKEKSRYLSGQALIKSFGAYPLFSGFESSPKTCYPFSECYINPEEAREVESRLYHYHQSLIELYTEIIGQEGDYTL